MEWTTLTNKLCTDPPWPCIWQPELQIYSREVKKSRGEVSSNLALPQNDIPIYAHLNHLGGQCVCKPLDHWMLADFLIFEGQTQPVSSLPCWLLESHPIASEHAVLRAAQAVLSLEPPQIGHLFRPTKMATFMVENVHVNMCYMC